MSHNVVFEIPMSTNGGSQVMSKQKRKSTSKAGPSEPEGTRGLSPSTEVPGEAVPPLEPEPPPAPEQPAVAEPGPVEGPSALTSAAETTAAASARPRKDKAETDPHKPGFLPEVLDSTVIARPLFRELKIQEAKVPPEQIKGYDLRLMSSVKDVSGIPTAGKRLIILAVVDQVLHFRIFNDDAKMVEDTDANRLAEQKQPIEDLEKQIENLWPPHELTESEKDEVIAAVTSIVCRTPIKIIIDLNLEYPDGRDAAREQAVKLMKQVLGEEAFRQTKPINDTKTRYSKQYIFCKLYPKQIRDLVALDQENTTAATAGVKRSSRSIFHIWPDFPINSLTTKSISTVKADAARNSFSAMGEGIVWAVIDSGIDGKHPHFKKHKNLEYTPALAHSDFTGTDDPKEALIDEYGHGTHVAGIIAGELVSNEMIEKEYDLRLMSSAKDVNDISTVGKNLIIVAAVDNVLHFRIFDGGGNVVPETAEESLSEKARQIEDLKKQLAGLWPPHELAGSEKDGVIAAVTSIVGYTLEKQTCRIQATTRFLDQDEKVKTASYTPEKISGMAPRCKLLSLKVLDKKGNGEASNLIAAMEYIQEINGNGRRIRVHGVNMSVGYDFEPEWFACGQSPVCVEVDRLVKSGVVVVVAAGNSGYGAISPASGRVFAAGIDLTINDPGNAELAITVGSTHRDMPHVYGVSYFSSKGPTGDGRPKPDLVAPGEKIISCKSGKRPKPTAPGATAPAKPAAPASNPPVAAAGLESPVAGSSGENDNYEERSGTSMAAPHVSGVIADFLSIRKEFIGKPEAVKEIFLSTATDLKRVPYFQGRGLVDLMRAIQSV
jgi:subtilisin family serine protease